MALKDGIFSAILRSSGGTFASPTGLSEVDLVTDSINIPWELGSTPSSARKTRTGPRVVDGQANYGTQFDFTVEDDPEDANLIALLDALNNKTEVILLVSPYIKGKYRIYGGSPSYSPGKPNGRSFRAAVHVSCPANEAPVLVEPE